MRTEAVTREEAERRGATNVAEALAGETTIQVNPEAYGYLGRPSGAQIQGLDGDRVLVLEDGEPVLGDVGGVVDLAQLSLMDVERVEYVAGPMSSLYGTNALGGVINIISAPPRTQGLSLRYREEARSRGELFAETSAAHRDGDAWQALDASFRHRRGVAHEDRPDLFVPFGRFYAVGLRTGVSPSQNVELRFKARWARDEAEGLRTENRPRPFVLDMPETTDRFNLQAQQTVHVGDGHRVDLSLRSSWFVTDTRERYRQSAVGTVRRRRLANQSAEAVTTLADGNDRTWVLGLRVETESFEQLLHEVSATAAGQLERTFAYEVEPTRITTGALFGQLAWRLFERLTLLPGTRVELDNRFGTVAAPRIAAAVDLTRTLVVRGAVGRGFRAPSAKEIGFNFDHSTFSYKVEGNPDLRPEASWGATLDATQRWEDARVRVGVFSNWIRELIALEPDFADVTIYRYYNISRARTAGGDVSIRARAGEHVAADAGYAYSWTRDESTGEPLPNRPTHTVTLGVQLELPAELHLAGRYRWTAGFHGFEDAPEPVSSFAVLDAQLAFRAWPSLEAYLGGQNLTDVHRDPDNPADLRPALGRTLYVGLRGHVPGEN